MPAKPPLPQTWPFQTFPQTPVPLALRDGCINSRADSQGEQRAKIEVDPELSILDDPNTNVRICKKHAAMYSLLLSAGVSQFCDPELAVSVRAAVFISD